MLREKHDPSIENIQHYRFCYEVSLTPVQKTGPTDPEPQLN